ncbi:MAG: TIGR03663 family protein [Desulfobulbaceae bacterium]|nr:TIGR03663 family protein [Desulfobulbaceae bacterium]
MSFCAQHYLVSIKNRSDLGWLLVLLLMAAGLRLSLLEVTPFHHDESIHAWFSYRLWTGHSYTYDPIYHGPFLYWTTAAMYSVFGDNDFTARLLPAVFSSGLIALCWLLRSIMGKIGWVAAAFFITLSPTFTYYGRFLAHDNYVAFFTLASVLLATRFVRSEKKSTLSLLGVVIGCFMATKACFYLHLGIFAGFGFFVLILDTFAPKMPRKMLLQSAADLAGRNWQGVMLACGLALLTYTALYSSFFSNWKGIADGLVQTVSYWWGQQMEPRIPGPFYYYLPRLLLHEPVFYLVVPAVIWAGVRKVRPFDLFLAYWTLAAFIVYSFAQEKVPWLLLHILLPMTLLSGRYVQILAEKKSFRPWIALSLVVLLSWSLRESLWLCFKSSPEDPHLLKYMATANDIRKVVTKITADTTSSRQVIVSGKATWPLAWYLRDQDIIFDLPAKWAETADTVIVDRTEEVSGNNFAYQSYVLSNWWQPDYKQLLTSGLYPYLVKRQVRDEKGSFTFIMLTRHE